MRSTFPALLALLAVLVTACGGGEGEPVGTTTPSDPADTTTTTVAAVEDFHPDDAGWSLVWSDEFDGAELDRDNWEPEENCWGGGNNELQCYTDRADNVHVADGLLHVVARKESFTGPAQPADWGESSATSTLPFTSGRIRTKGLADWTYGRFEIRAQLPEGQGIWPAIWMLPTDSPYGGWAAGGEIDIMEAVNLKTVDAAVSSTVHGTLHYGKEWPENVFSGHSFYLPRSEHPSDMFHVYAIEWEEGEIRWYVDDTHYATQRADGWYTKFPGWDGEEVVGLGAAPFDQPFHLLINLAVGGNWPGPPDGDTSFPQELLVDYVRVYRCDASPQDGIGCATTSPDATLVEGIPPVEPLFDAPLTGTFDPAGLGDTMEVFIDDRVYPWDLHYWSASGAVEFELVDTGEEGHGSVVQASFATNEAVVYFQAPDTYDLSDWEDGFVEFDLRLVEQGSATQGFQMKVDCVHPCSTNDVPIGDLPLGEWASFSLPISELVERPGSSLDLRLVNTPLVVFPTWGVQDGAVVQIDNVRWTR